MPSTRTRDERLPDDRELKRPPRSLAGDAPKQPRPTERDGEARRPRSFAVSRPSRDIADLLIAVLDSAPHEMPTVPAPAPQPGLGAWLSRTFTGEGAPVPPGQLSTPGYIQHFLRQNPGTEAYPAEDAFQAAKEARHPNPRNLNLRDAEHALFSQQIMDSYGPIVGRAMVGTMVPGYSAAKVAAQSGIPGAAPAVRALTGMDLQHSTPPDLRELYWGLRPFFGSIR